jgi:hypothetical protein
LPDRPPPLHMPIVYGQVPDLRITILGDFDQCKKFGGCLENLPKNSAKLKWKIFDG